jgi:hypothetical protein
MNSHLAHKLWGRPRKGDSSDVLGENAIAFRCGAVLLSGERHPTIKKIEGQALSAKEFQTQKPIDTFTGRRRVTQHWKVIALLPRRCHLAQRQARGKFHTTTRSHLDTLSRERRIVAYRNQQP